jgi:hypothetical protein
VAFFVRLNLKDTQMKFIKLFNPFLQPLTQDIIRTSLIEYERSLLEHEAATSYSQKMVEYYRDGIKRLQKQAVELV